MFLSVKIDIFRTPKVLFWGKKLTMFYFFQGRFTFFLLLIPPYNHCIWRLDQGHVKSLFVPIVSSLFGPQPFVSLALIIACRHQRCIPPMRSRNKRNTLASGRGVNKEQERPQEGWNIRPLGCVSPLTDHSNCDPSKSMAGRVVAWLAHLMCSNKSPIKVPPFANAKNFGSFLPSFIWLCLCSLWPPPTGRWVLQFHGLFCPPRLRKLPLSLSPKILCPVSCLYVLMSNGSCSFNVAPRGAIPPWGR